MVRAPTRLELITCPPETGDSSAGLTYLRRYGMHRERRAEADDKRHMRYRCKPLSHSARRQVRPFEDSVRHHEFQAEADIACPTRQETLIRVLRSTHRNPSM